MEVNQMNKREENLLMKAMNDGIRLEKERHPDFDEDKHMIKVTIDSINGTHLKLNFRKVDKK